MPELDGFVLVLLVYLSFALCLPGRLAAPRPANAGQQLSQRRSPVSPRSDLPGIQHPGITSARAEPPQPLLGCTGACEEKAASPANAGRRTRGSMGDPTSRGNESLTFGSGDGGEGSPRLGAPGTRRSHA